MSTGSREKDAPRTGAKSGIASTAKDLRKRRPPTLGDVHAAVRTLAVMADCYERRQPQRRGPTGGGVDRVLETALLDVVAKLKDAAEAQLSADVGKRTHVGSTRTAATLQLRDSLAEAYARATGRRVAAKYRASKVRTGHLPPPGGLDALKADVAKVTRVAYERDDATARTACHRVQEALGRLATAGRPPGSRPPGLLPLSALPAREGARKTAAKAEDRLVCEVLISASEYEQSSGIPLDRLRVAGALVGACRLAFDSSEDPAPAGRALAAALVQVSEATLEKWERGRRGSKNRAEQPQRGEPTAFFGASFDQNDFSQLNRRLCAPFGGDAFVRAAAAELGLEQVLRIAVALVEQQAPLWPADARSKAIRDAVTAACSALGGHCDGLGQPATEENSVRAGSASGLWRLEDFDYGWRLAACARGEWNGEQ